MEPNTHFAAGVICTAISSAVYTFAVIYIGFETGNVMAWRLGIVTAGAAYVSNVVGTVWPRSFAALPLFVVSVLIGAVAGLSALIGR